MSQLIFGDAESAGKRKLGDVRVAEDFEMSARELAPQGGDGGECEDEITNRPAADDEDAALLRRHKPRKAVSPSPATNRPNTRPRPQCRWVRDVVAVPQSSRSRKR